MSDILFNPSSLPIAKTLHVLLGKTLAGHQAQDEALATSQSVVMNFRDSSYNADDGGFHPVEIADLKAENAALHESLKSKQNNASKYGYGLGLRRRPDWFMVLFSIVDEIPTP